MSVSTFSETQLHTIRLTGRLISQLEGARSYLLNLLQDCPDRIFSKGTSLRKLHPILPDSPIQLLIDSEKSPDFQLQTNVIVPEVNYTHLHNKLNEWFSENHQYLEFRFEDICLLMKETGFQGFLKTDTDELVLFSSEEYLS